MESQKRIIGFKKIRFAKKDGGLVTMAHFGVGDNGAINNESSNKIDVAPSAEFDIQLRTLIGHALLFASLDGKKLGEKEMNSRKVVDMPQFKNVNISSFKISGDPGEDNEALSITLEISARGGVFSITVPPIYINDESYEHQMILAEDLDAVLEHVHKYNEVILKVQQSAQLDLFSNTTEDPIAKKKTKVKKDNKEEQELDGL